jgi:hypothetical protein
VELEKAKDFCNRWLPAWTGNNPELLVSQGLKGNERIVKYFRKFISYYPDWKYEYVEIFPTEKGFTLKWKVSLPINSDTIVDFGLDIVEISNDKIIRNEVYFDTARLQKAIKEKQSQKT